MFSRICSAIIKKLCLSLLICALLSVSVFAQKPVKDLKPTVILISLDGFRYDYLEKYKPKNLNRLAGEGVRADWMIPSFPTKTFPNHYAIATGLYPEHNGIIENNIYDKNFDAVFSLGNRAEVQNPRWWLGEPIWVTAEKQGQIAAAFFFPGTETKIMGFQPDYWKEYDGKIPNLTRVETVLSWLDLPSEKRPTMITMYFSDTDDAGHNFSPDSPETADAVAKVDEDLGKLLDGLKQRKIYDSVNLIVVSDHGMASVVPQNAIFLDDFINFDDTERILWTNEITQIFPKAGKEDEMIENLQGKIKHADCWLKNQIPARLHYNESSRIAPIVCSTDEGWIQTSHERQNKYAEKTDLTKPRGGHGYDNILRSMQAIFITHGKAFRKNLRIKPFENIQVYNLMANILNLTPAQNDGDQNLSRLILKKKPKEKK